MATRCSTRRSCRGTVMCKGSGRHGNDAWDRVCLKYTLVTITIADHAEFRAQGVDHISGMMMMLMINHRRLHVAHPYHPSCVAQLC